MLDLITCKTIQFKLFNIATACMYSGKTQIKYIKILQTLIDRQDEFFTVCQYSHPGIAIITECIIARALVSKAAKLQAGICKLQ